MIPRKPLTVKRSPSGAYINGIWTEPGNPTPLVIQASVQPASQRDAVLLPEGRRVSASYRLFTDDVLKLPSPGQNSDVVEIGGRDYDVVAEADWQNSVMPHRQYLVSLVQQ